MHVHLDEKRLAGYWNACKALTGDYDSCDSQTTQYDQINGLLGARNYQVSTKSSSGVLLGFLDPHLDPQLCFMAPHFIFEGGKYNKTLYGESWLESRYLFQTVVEAFIKDNVSRTLPKDFRRSVLREVLYKAQQG